MSVLRVLHVTSFESNRGLFVRLEFEKLQDFFFFCVRTFLLHEVMDGFIRSLFKKGCCLCKTNKGGTTLNVRSRYLNGELFCN